MSRRFVKVTEVKLPEMLSRYLSQMMHDRSHHAASSTIVISVLS